MMNDLILNLPEFCERGEMREGRMTPDAFPRVFADLIDTKGLRWRVTGAVVTRQELPTYTGCPVLTLVVHGIASLPCTRCLEPVSVEVAIDHRYVGVATEGLADEALIDDEHYDAVVTSSNFDLAQLIEDEVLMTLEALAQHGRCDPRALAALGLAEAGDGVALHAPKDNPFAVLNVLKKH